MDRDDGAEAQSIYSLVYGSLEDDSTTRKKANEENAKHEPKFTAAPPASASPYCNVDADALATLPSLGRSDKDIRSAWGSSSQYGSSYSSGLQSLYGNPYGDCYGAKLPSPPRPSLKNSANQAEGASMSENSSPNRYGQLDSSKEDGNIHLSLSDSTQRVDGVKDWNAEFQTIQDRLGDLQRNKNLSSSEFAQESSLLYRKLNTLARDFEHAAELYGKIIISEVCLVPSNKTLRAAQLGGQGGGSKFVVRGILFKFARDVHGLYNGDAGAMKAASHELRGLATYYRRTSNTPELHFPLMVIVDHLGFRLVAQTILPISNFSIIYGSPNAGKNVYNQNQTFNKIMEQAAKKLNIKGHYVGMAGQHYLHGPVDIEGHYGSDGRFYLIDFARVFPPEYFTRETWEKGQHLYQQLRPELVRTNSVPLSSDALSNFGLIDSETHNFEVQQATQRLLQEVIPSFARQMERSVKSGQSITGFQLCSDLHRFGINMRHMGNVRHRCDRRGEASRLLLTEMVAREIKNSLRRRLRMAMRRVDAAVEGPFREETLNYLNLVFSRQNASENSLYWRTEVKVELGRSFPNSLFGDEKDLDFDLRDSGLSVTQLLNRVLALSAVKLAPGTVEELKQDPNSFELVDADILELGVRTKQLNIVAHAQAAEMSMQSIRRGSACGERLFHIAIAKYKDALAAAPDCEDTLNCYAEALYQFAQRKKGVDRRRHFSEALQQWKIASNGTALLCLADKLRELLRDEQNDIVEQAAIFRLGANAYQGAVELFEVEARADPLPDEQNPPSPGDLHLSPMTRMKSLGHGEVQRRRKKKSVMLEKDGSSMSRSGGSSSSLEAETPPLQRRRRTTDSRVRGPLQGSLSDVPDSARERLALTCYNWGLLLLEQLSNIGDERLHKKAGQKFARAFQNGLDMHCELLPWVLDQPSPRIATIVEVARQSPSMDSISSLKCFHLLPQDVVTCALHCGSSLQHLEMPYSSIEDADIQIIAGNCALLKRVDLRGCRAISSVALMAIARTCREISEVDFGGCTLVDDSGVIALAANCKCLKKLQAEHCERITNEGLKALANSSGLLALGLKATSISDAGLLPVVKGCTKLAELDLKRTRVSDVSMKGIAEHLHRSLTTLRVGWCEDISMDGIVQVTSKCRLLRDIDLTGWHTGVNRVLEDLVSNCETLLKLEVPQCPQLHSLTAHRVAKAFDTIRTLDLRGCGRISGEALEELIRPQTDLETLLLDDCGALLVGIVEKPSDKSVIAAATPSLTELSIANCSLITDKAIEEVSKACSSLKQLNMRGCKRLTDASLSALGENCSQLQDLSVEGCVGLSAAGIMAVAKACPLHRLNLANCVSVTPRCITSVASFCPLQLQSINLSGCPKVNDDALITLSKQCLFLASAFLSGCSSISDKGVTALATYCGMLLDVDVSWCTRVTDDAILAIAGCCPGLRDVSLSVLPSVTGGSVGKIGRSSLRTLNVSMCDDVDDDAIVKVVQQSPFLRRLDTGWCTKLTDKAMMEISRSIVSLRQLCLSRCAGITDEGVTAVAAAFPALRTIDLKDCNQVTDVAVKALARHCKQLQFVCLCGTSATDAGVIELVQECNALRTLDLKSLIAVTDASLNVIGQQCTVLHDLSIGGWGCSQITDDSLAAIADGCAFLERLDISHCKVVSDFGVAALLKHCDSLVKLDVSGIEVTDDSIVQLARNNFLLKELSIASCKRISTQALMELSNNCIWLELLNLSNCPQFPPSVKSQLRDRLPGVKLLGMGD